MDSVSLGVLFMKKKKEKLYDWYITYDYYKNERFFKWGILLSKSGHISISSMYQYGTKSAAIGIMKRYAKMLNIKLAPKK